MGQLDDALGIDYRRWRRPDPRLRDRRVLASGAWRQRHGDQPVAEIEAVAFELIVHAAATPRRTSRTLT